MIENYQQLQDLVKQALEQQTYQDIRFDIADNQACHLIHTPSGRKMVLMLARLDDEFRVGFAFFQAGQRHADWIEDVLATGVSTNFIHQLIELNLLQPPAY